jgi:hypothetical protein
MPSSLAILGEPVLGVQRTVGRVAMSSAWVATPELRGDAGVRGSDEVGLEDGT